MPKVLDKFEFNTQTRQRWPEEWFDGQIRQLSPADLRCNPEDPQEKFASDLTNRRQSLMNSARIKELEGRANWYVNSKGEVTNDLVFQAVKPKPQKSK